MRPLFLHMKAFGPFIDASVDFERIGNRLYLISGETGSGKTTIFDAMTYALYGQVSGENRERAGIESFHSDFARHENRYDELSVLFRFSSGTHVYEAWRRVYWGKTGAAEKAQRESTLKEDGKMIAEGRGREKLDDVTRRITVILGLDADQFRRIVMLAQGEFNRFLSADTKQRAEILGQLMDNRPHLDLEARMKAAGDCLNRDIRKITDEIDIHLKNGCPDDLPEEQKAVLSPLHPDLWETLKTLCEKEKESLDQCRTLLEKKRNEMQRVTGMLSEASEINRQFELLEKQRDKNVRLAHEAEHTDTWTQRVNLAEAALKVLPFREQAENAARQLDHIEKKIVELTVEAEKAAFELEKAKTVLREEQEKSEPEIVLLQQKNAVLKEQLPLYGPLEETKSELERAIKQAQEKKEQLAIARSQGEKLNADLYRCEEELHLYDQAGETAVLLARQELEQNKSRSKELDYLEKQGRKLQEREEQIRLLVRSCLELQDEASVKEMVFDKLYRSFLAGQAGMLADEMRRVIRQTGKAVCPVCHTVHGENSVKYLEIPPAEVPDREKVEHARLDAEESKKVWSAKEAERVSLEKTLEDDRLAFSHQAENLIGSDVQAGDSQILRECLAKCVSEEKQIRERLKKAEKDQLKKNELLQLRETLVQEKESAETLLQKLDVQRQEAEQRAASLQASFHEKKTALWGLPESYTEASALYSEREKACMELQEKLTAAGNILQTAERKQSDLAGQLAEARRQLVLREKEAEDAKTRFLEQKKSLGFASDEDWNHAMQPEGKKLDSGALAVWCQEKKKQIETLENALRENTTQIRQLTEMTAGKEKKDISALEKSLNILKMETDQMGEKQEKLSARRMNLARASERIGTLLAEKEKRVRALQRLAPMADMACGSACAFHVYVLQDFFERIVAQANLRLGVMNGGEYELVACDGTDGRVSHGLDLAVRDNLAGTQRDVRLLSGGQTFETSLALALGLSEAVQQESTGNVRMESLFIDEGFGSLDSARLEKALSVLQGLLENQRQIGIISHVEQLEEALPDKIRVFRDGLRGSRIEQ